MGGNKETQGTHHCIIHHVQKSIGWLPFHSTYTCLWPGCFSYTGQGLEEIIYLDGIRNCPVILQVFFLWVCFIHTYACVMLRLISQTVLPVFCQYSLLNHLSQVVHVFLHWTWLLNGGIIIIVFFDPVVLYTYIIFKINLLAISIICYTWALTFHMQWKDQLSFFIKTCNSMSICMWYENFLKWIYRFWIWLLPTFSIYSFKMEPYKS